MNAASIAAAGRFHVVVLALLALMMAATRYHHFGSALHLPDASLAVFFAAGFYLRQRWPLALLLGEAALIDYLATGASGAGGWCISPAYPFLIPAYAAMWLGGRWYSARHDTGWPAVTALVTVLAIAGSAAFLISNGSFYLLSGAFPDLSWAQFTARAALYYWPYLSSAFVYLASIALVHTLVVAAMRARGLGRMPLQ
ncbi:MAG: hypothetical protein IPL03_17990 [Sterolibacteriaceae bacterium]|nr:hypothetical protein [Candidatus Methylophosphatis haderslevensis]